MNRKIICPRCGKITAIDHDCPNKPRDIRKKDQLWSSRWINVRDSVRRRDGCCVLCWKEGTFTKGEEVHHIKPREVDNSDDSIYNEDNCIYLCKHHHHLVHSEGWQKYYDEFKDYIKGVKHD